MRLFLLAVAAYGVLSAQAAPGVHKADNRAIRDVDGRIPRRRIPPSHAVHERHEPQHTEGWTRVELADPIAILPMRIGLKQSNLDLGHELLMNLSHPKSPHYGKRMTPIEVTDLFAPANESVDAVTSWLISESVPAASISRSANKQWIQFDSALTDAERLLHTTFYVYEHDESGIRNIACGEYHVPHSVQQHIDYITPGIKLLAAGYDETRMELARRRRRRRSDKRQNYEYDIAHIETDDADDIALLRNPGSCAASTTPACVKAQYQIPNGTRAARGNELGIFQGLSQHYNQLDLDTYFSNVAPWIANGTHPELRSINGAEGPTVNQMAAGEEADLDFEVAIPLVHPQRTVLYQTDDEWYQLDQQKATTRYTGFFNTFFDALDGSYCRLSAFGETGDCTRDQCRDPEYPNPNADRGWQGQVMCGRYQPTNVIAISYSGVESVLPASYMQRQCLEVLKLALQGVTVVESSGDYGVGGRRNDPKAGCLGPNRDIFSPRTMSNCPYVLSVGATVLVNDTCRGPDKYKEVAPTYFASGGGFSNVFPTPEWQRRHVDSYLFQANVSHLGYTGAGFNFSHVGVEPGKLFNKAGRGYPDVAAIGENYLVHMQGFSDHLGGTSVAVPIWASILTLINEERLARGKGTVGFVHQVLYDHPEVFTDITKGSNPGCGSGGFQVRKGWDPVTGLGSPVYPKLLKLFLSLP
ncbi:peptidase S8/S53 domain-containing protein [Coniochaeta sp. 2T2.1]|nr:peptidase S8/S53 domain-containing protein [Coniochaeta sp. 2T2.1]